MNLFKITLLLLLFSFGATSQVINTLIPANTATHTAVQSGSWFSPTTWNTNSVPSDAAIVDIPLGIAVTYEGQSDAHIFAIRVAGDFNCTQQNTNDTTTLTFDTFVGLMTSKTTFHANTATHGSIDVSIKPFPSDDPPLDAGYASLIFSRVAHATRGWAPTRPGVIWPYGSWSLHCQVHHN